MHYKRIAFTANYEVTIPPFTTLIRRIEIQEYRSGRMLSISSKIPKKKKARSLQPILPLIPEKLPSKDDDKSSFLTFFDLNVKEGQNMNSTKYKKPVCKFEEGSPQQWIDLLKDLQEIWKQNSIEGGSDQVAAVRGVK